jgi:3-phenylpropionate/trans-cinnamate dioxygenase ferredoxin component
MTEEAARWVEVSPLERLVDEGILCVRVEAVDLLLVRDSECIAACERACPHEQADLGLGRITDGRLFCPRHQCPALDVSTLSCVGATAGCCNS